MIYKLEVNKQQLQIISKSLELYSRLGVGQFEYLLEHTSIDKYMDIKCKLEDNVNLDTDIDWPKRGFLQGIAREHINFLKKILMDCSSDSSHGIHNEKVNGVCRTAWDLQQIIRHHLWSEMVDRNENSVASSVCQSDVKNPLMLISHD